MAMQLIFLILLVWSGLTNGENGGDLVRQELPSLYHSVKETVPDKLERLFAEWSGQEVEWFREGLLAIGLKDASNIKKLEERSSDVAAVLGKVLLLQQTRMRYRNTPEYQVIDGWTYGALNRTGPQPDGFVYRLDEQNNRLIIVEYLIARMGNPDARENELHTTLRFWKLGGFSVLDATDPARGRWYEPSHLFMAFNPRSSQPLKSTKTEVFESIVTLARPLGGELPDRVVLQVSLSQGELRKVSKGFILEFCSKQAVDLGTQSARRVLALDPRFEEELVRQATEFIKRNGRFPRRDGRTSFFERENHLALRIQSTMGSAAGIYVRLDDSARERLCTPVSCQIPSAFSLEQAFLMADPNLPNTIGALRGYLGHYPQQSATFLQSFLDKKVGADPNFRASLNGLLTPHQTNCRFRLAQLATFNANQQ